ncbi:MAG: FAD-dependent oxidoreductase, partial [Leucobacter sp.]|nr:FAD-dependent oxidoreductase [Leucobacter sp.]
MAGMVIVGGGLAAEGVAKTLRRESYEGEITVIAEEPHLLYERPPLSKEFLAGKASADKVILHDQAWYDEQRITVRTGIAATAISPAEHRVTLADGSTLDYDKLVLATGSSARTLPIDGHDLDGVFTLRTLDDATALHDALKAGDKNLVLIGSGWIGMEVAASARALGNTVTVLERGRIPLERALGAEIGREFERVHLEHGVVFRTEAGVEAIEGAGGRVTGVRVDGEVIPADLVLVGVGAAPNTALAETAGLEVSNGIVTDASMRTSAADVFAAGDVASSFHPVLGQHLRSEHWQNAKSSAKVAAQAMLGQAAQHDEIPYFYTDQYDLGM